MSYKFKITKVDLDAGYAILKVDLPDNTIGELTVDTYSIVSTDEATEKEIEHALKQLVESYVDQLFPAPKPKPEALLKMINRRYGGDS